MIVTYTDSEMVIVRNSTDGLTVYFDPWANDTSKSWKHIFV